MVIEEDQNPKQEQAQKPTTPLYDLSDLRKDYFPSLPEDTDINPLLIKSVRECIEEKLGTWAFKAQKVFQNLIDNPRALPNQTFPLAPNSAKRKDILLRAEEFWSVFKKYGIGKDERILKIACFIALREIREKPGFQGRAFASYKRKVLLALAEDESQEEGK